MEVIMREIGNSVGTIFPKAISPKVGEKYTIIKVGETYILKPKKEDIFLNKEQWTGFRDELTKEDENWDIMSLEEKIF